MRGIDLNGSDLEFWSFTDCEFRQAGLDETRLRGSRLSEVIMGEIDAAVFSAPRTSWRNVEVTGSRLGSAELYASTWRSVTIAGSKINYLNARTADWQDVRFTDCTLDELDLSDATVTRLAFTGCRIGTLTLGGARLTDVDLRDVRLEMINGLAGLAGAWVSEISAGRTGPAAGRAPGDPGQFRLVDRHPSCDDQLLWQRVAVPSAFRPPHAAKRHG